MKQSEEVCVCMCVFEGCVCVCVCVFEGRVCVCVGGAGGGR